MCKNPFPNETDFLLIFIEFDGNLFVFFGINK